MKITKIKKFNKKKNKVKVYLITLGESVELEVQLDKDKKPEIISFDRFLLMTGKKPKKKNIGISFLQFLKMFKRTNIPVMIEKLDPELFKITKEEEKIIIKNAYEKNKRMQLLQLQQDMEISHHQMSHIRYINIRMEEVFFEKQLTGVKKLLIILHSFEKQKNQKLRKLLDNTR